MNAKQTDAARESEIKGGKEKAGNKSHVWVRAFEPPFRDRSHEGRDADEWGKAMRLVAEKARVLLNLPPVTDLTRRIVARNALAPVPLIRVDACRVDTWRCDERERAELCRAELCRAGLCRAALRRSALWRAEFWRAEFWRAEQWGQSGWRCEERHVASDAKLCGGCFLVVVRRRFVCVCVHRVTCFKVASKEAFEAFTERCDQFRTQSRVAEPHETIALEGQSLGAPDGCAEHFEKTENSRPGTSK